jgi:hypothetical protein
LPSVERWKAKENKMKTKAFTRVLILFLPSLTLSFGWPSLHPSKDRPAVTLENQNFRIAVDPQNGAVTSFLIKKNDSDLIGEKRLAANFRICLPLDDYLGNYIEGTEQAAKSVTREGDTIIVTFSGMKSARGTFPVDLTYFIKMGEDSVALRAKLTNHDPHPISEFWFPRLGGLKGFGGGREAKLACPGYNQDCRHSISLFRSFPGVRGLGAEAAEWSTDYQAGMPMPWWDIYDEGADLGLYLGYHDTTYRYSTWHVYLVPDVSGDADSWLTDEQAAGQPVGIVFSHVRYPFIHSGETLDSGEFIIRVHPGDWHQGSRFYREWFLSHFPFDKSKSWLRKESTWFSSIIYQPEDKIITGFKGYGRWTEDAKKYGIGCYELIGWHSGGLERNYPLYIPEDKLGGREQFKALLKSIRERGDHCLVFCNYNILDECTDWYKKELYKYMAQDQFGNQGIWMAWGESTLLARKGLSVRYHVRASIVPEMEKILEGFLVPLARNGAQGFQIDKVCVASALDFNPLNTAKPDVALCEGLVQAIARLYEKCRAVNPGFRIASEFGLDRLIPYFDVGYRNSAGYEISPLRYVFPEWTSCQHVSAPRDFRGINGAVLTGSVICIEPDSYQGTLAEPIYQDLAKYIQEVARLRKELGDIIFLGKYYDDQDARILEVSEPNPAGIGPGGPPVLRQPTGLRYKIHGHYLTDRRAIVIANDSAEPLQYVWEFTHKKIKKALLYAPFRQVTTVDQGDPVTIKGGELNILVEKP